MFYQRVRRWPILNQLRANVACFWLILLSTSGADPGYVERGGVARGLGDLPHDFLRNLDAPNAFSRILVIYFRLSLW